MKPTLILEAETMADKPPVFMPVSEDRLAQEAWLHALRANSDAIERLAKSSERRDEQFADLGKTLANMNTRLTLLESSPLQLQIDGIKARLKTVEDDQLRRQGREGVWAALLRSPFVHWMTAVGTAIATAFVLLRDGSGQ